MDTMQKLCTLPIMHDRIAELRKQRGWSMRELAHRTNSSASTINSLEKGKTELTLSWLQRLSKAFGVGVEELLGLPRASLPNFSLPSSRDDSNVKLYDDIAHVETDKLSDLSILNLATNQSVYVVTSNSLNQLISFGSLIVVERKKIMAGGLQPGDIVVGRYREAENNSLLIRQFVAPNLLITNSSDNNLPSINLNNESFELEGRVLWAMKPFTRLTALAEPA
jgi:transcriptional regulator with XRE-family HTH domain